VEPIYAKSTPIFLLRKRNGGLKVLIEKFENFELAVFSDFAENGTLVNFVFFSGGLLGIKRIAQ